MLDVDAPLELSAERTESPAAGADRSGRASIPPPRRRSHLDSPGPARSTVPRTALLAGTPQRCRRRGRKEPVAAAAGLFGNWQRPERRASMIARRGRSTQWYKVSTGWAPASRRGPQIDVAAKFPSTSEIAGLRARVQGSRAASLVGHQPAIETARRQPGDGRGGVSRGEASTDRKLWTRRPREARQSMTPTKVAAPSARLGSSDGDARQSIIGASIRVSRRHAAACPKDSASHPGGLEAEAKRCIRLSRKTLRRLS